MGLDLSQPVIDLTPPRYDTKIEFQQVNHGVNGFISFVDLSGDRWKTRTTGHTFTYADAEDDPPKIYKVQTTTGTKFDPVLGEITGTKTETWGDPWDTSTLTTTGDEDLTNVTVTVSDPWDASELTDPPNAGEWVDVFDTYGDGHSGVEEGVDFYPLYSLAAGLWTGGVRKRRWRLKVSAAGFAGGGVRLQIVKHKQPQEADMSPSDAFALFGLSTIAKDYDLSATLTSGDLSLSVAATVGKLGDFQSPSCTGNWRYDSPGGGVPRVHSSLDPSLIGTAKKPFIWALFDGSEVTKMEFTVDGDPDSAGQYLVSEWQDVPDPDEWYFIVWYFLIDWPCVGLVGGDGTLIPDDGS